MMAVGAVKFSVGLFPVIVAVFVSLARSEERRMLEQFGEEFRAYRQRAPRFVPRWGQCASSPSTRILRPGLNRPESATG